MSYRAHGHGRELEGGFLGFYLYQNDQLTATGLLGYLRERGFQRVALAGLATDFCVAFSALDAARLGFEATVIEDACRAIDLDGSLAAAWERMTQAGVLRSSASQFAG